MPVRRAVCPGSYDPVTVGHLDVIARARRLYDEVVVAVLHNPAKAGVFPVEQRIALIEASLTTLPRDDDGVGGGGGVPEIGGTLDAGDDGGGRVRVAAFAGRLLVDVCRELDAQVILKGLRSSTDFDYELPMAMMNRHLTGVETVFLPGDPRWQHVSSSLVKEVARYGGDITGLVPDRVRDALLVRLHELG